MTGRKVAGSLDRHGERVMRSESPGETERLGRELARCLRAPAVVLLSGSLGTGKTTLTRGIAAGLGIADPAVVHSPSFTIVNVYRGHCPVYHVDLYRLGGKRDLSSIGLDDFVGRDGITIVEWGERLPYDGRVDLAIELEDAGGDTRILRLRQRASGARKKNLSSIRRGRGLRQTE